MNIEIKRSIEIDSVLQVLKERSEKNKVGKMGEEVVIRKDVLKDAVSVIEFLVKKNKQLRDISKTLTDKITRKNNTISELGKQAKELNDKLFEVQKELDSCKNDTCNCCCKNEEEEPTLQEVLNELEVLHELVVISKSIGIL